MNIAEAKKQVKNAMSAYFSRDEYGRPELPPESQRPVFLLGPPGVGKTAIMSQLAQELGVGLVSYSMTHHTRQSALGLPMIVQKTYGGREYSVSEYTMSEIIASVYDEMEETGCREGILFLDEINCVSETLAPTMLQFLQFKTFGRHRVPEGWLVAAAGNPPEYNRAARDFDIVTWDRLKRIDVEPDYAAWREYARKKGVHAAVLCYLDGKKDNFYRVEATVEGKRFVTARGWDDLSDMMQHYERHGMAVDGALIDQYLQQPEIAQDFALYYELWNKYRSDYPLDAILAGQAPAAIVDRARSAPFDERLSLLGLLLERVEGPLAAATETEDVLLRLRDILRRVKAGGDIRRERDGEAEALDRARRRRGLTARGERQAQRVLAFLQEREEADLESIRADFAAETERLRESALAAGRQLDGLFTFAEAAFGEGNELLILVTELTAGESSARFIARWGCPKYYAHSSQLQFYERRREIARQLEQLETEL